MKTNDRQEEAIYDAITIEHSKLFEMYEERKQLEKRQQKELDNFIEKIGKQEVKVQELCKGRIKFYVDSDNRIIIDLTE